MKRIEPVTRYEAECAYPSVADCALDRRGFLRGAVAGAAALGASLLPAAAAVARGRRKWLRVELPLRARLRGCHRRYVEKLIVQTQSRRLQRFLQHKSERAVVLRRLHAVLGRHTCDDTRDRKRLARLEKALAQALVKCYAHRRRRQVATPIVTLVMATRRPIRNPGFMAAPQAPVPRP